MPVQKKSLETYWRHHVNHYHINGLHLFWDNLYNMALKHQTVMHATVPDLNNPISIVPMKTMSRNLLKQITKFDS